MNIVPGQDILLNLGVAGVFILTVLAAVVALWKKSNSDRDATQKEARERAAIDQSERDRTRAEFFAASEKARAEYLEAIQETRADFLAESRRRDDRMESQWEKFSTQLQTLTRENNATVQSMQAKQDQSTAHLAAIADALSRRITTQG